MPTPTTPPGGESPIAPIGATSDARHALARPRGPLRGQSAVGREARPGPREAWGLCEPPRPWAQGAAPAVQATAAQPGPLRPYGPARTTARGALARDGQARRWAVAGAPWGYAPTRPGDSGCRFSPWKFWSFFGCT